MIRNLFVLCSQAGVEAVLLKDTCLTHPHTLCTQTRCHPGKWDKYSMNMCFPWRHWARQTLYARLCCSCVRKLISKLTQVFTSCIHWFIFHFAYKATTDLLMWYHNACSLHNSLFFMMTEYHIKCVHNKVPHIHIHIMWILIVHTNVILI